MGTVVALLAGGGVGAGLWLVISGWRRRPASPARSRRASGLGTVAWPAVVPKLAAAAVAGPLVGVLTGWPAAGLLTVVGVVGLPSLLGRDRDHQVTMARVEAVASWTELLRDTLAAAAGVQQTILATAATAPEPIRPQVGVLADRLRQGVPLPRALRAFADELGDPIADMVVAALLLAAERPSADLGQLLGWLATTARDQAAMRQRVATSRARVHTSARIITAVTVAMTVGMVVLNRPWMSAYDGFGGQLVMLLAGGMFAVGLVALRRMGRVASPPRLLAAEAGGGGGLR
ncbi:MAG: type II secretion system F family protein [Natronosporangium sp.]